MLGPSQVLQRIEWLNDLGKLSLQIAAYGGGSGKDPDVLALSDQEAGAGVNNRVGGVVSGQNLIVSSRGVPKELDCTVGTIAGSGCLG